jgi:hypothetical protein
MLWLPCTLAVALGCTATDNSSGGVWSTGQETGEGWWMTATEGESSAAPTAGSTTGFPPATSSSEGSSGGLPDGLYPQYVGDGFVDAFFAAEGLFVVSRDGVELIGRDGSVIRGYSSPRALVSAAFDGTSLAVADSAIVTILDPQLSSLAEITPAESCMSMVIVSGNRLVCGPEEDWDRLFYTYDMQSAELLATSQPYTYNGTPMRRVPGTDDFVTVTLGTSPPDFHLYRVAEDEAVYLNESPYHGDFAADLVQAYLGDPATHLVGADGTMLRIYAEDGACGGSPGSFDSACFVKDGELGLFPPEVSRYGDLREAPNGDVYGIYPTGDPWASDGLCEEAACVIQRLDPSARDVLETWEVVLDEAPHVMLRPDPTDTALALVSAHSTPFLQPWDDRTEFAVYFISQ